MRYLFIVLIFFSCNNVSTQEGIKVSTETLDTIQARPARWDAKPMILEAAFIKGTTQSKQGISIRLYGITIGKLKVSSGRVIACDPMLLEEYGIPFTQVFPTGDFPVQLSIAILDAGESIAFARIKFSDAPVARWEFALLPKQSPIKLASEEPYTYIVDNGVAGFMDHETKKTLDSLPEGLNNIYPEMQKHFHNNWRYTMYDVGKHNLAAFTPGFYGDGRYTTYIGFDSSGKPCRLVTDFNVLEVRRN
jgi:hypothetical protein